MSFDIQNFYEELDRYYQQHDNVKAEAFLLDMVDRTRALHDVGILPDSCPSCIPAATINLEYVSVCNETACFFRGISRFQRSIEFFDDALLELEHFSRQKTANYATILFNKAGTLRLMGHYDEAIAAFEGSESFFLEESNKNCYLLASIHNNMALTYQDQKFPEQAIKYIQLALADLPEIPETCAERGTSFNNLAAAYIRLGDYEAAKKAIDTSIAILKEFDHGLNAHYPAALNTLASLSYKKGNYTEALEGFQLALEKTEMIFGKNIDYKNGCLNLADTCDKLNKPALAKQYREEAAQVQRNLI